MQIEAIYKNGQLQFTRSIRFVRNQFKVNIEVPDEEILAVDLAVASPGPQSLHSPIDRLLAENPDDPWLKQMKAIEERILSLPEDELPELSSKQLQYSEAFAQREDC